jgi:hypothetical protein
MAPDTWSGAEPGDRVVLAVNREIRPDHGEDVGVVPLRPSLHTFQEQPAKRTTATSILQHCRRILESKVLIP